MGRDGVRPEGMSGGSRRPTRPTRPDGKRVGPNIPRGDSRGAGRPRPGVESKRPGEVPKRRPAGVGGSRPENARGSEGAKRPEGKGDIPLGNVKRPGTGEYGSKRMTKRPEKFGDSKPMGSRPGVPKKGDFNGGRPRLGVDGSGREDKEETYIYEEDSFGDDTIQLSSEDAELLGEVEDFLGESAYDDILDDAYYEEDLGDDLYGEDSYFDGDYDEDYGSYDDYNDYDEYDDDYDDYDAGDEDYSREDPDYYDGAGGGKLTENPWFIVVLTLGIIVVLVVTFNIGKSRGYKKGKQDAELQYMLDKKDSAGEVKDVEDDIEEDEEVKDLEDDKVVEETEILDEGTTGVEVDAVIDDVKDEVKEKVDSEVDKVVDEGTKVVDDVATGAITIVKETIDLSKFEDDVDYKLGDIVDNKGTIVQALSVDELLEHESVELKKDKFIEVGVLLQNSTDGVLKYGLDQFKIVDGDGKTHKPINKFAELEGYMDSSIDVEPGMELRGKIVFDVSDNVDTYTLVAKSKAGLVFDNVKIALR